MTSHANRVPVWPQECGKNVNSDIFSDSKRMRELAYIVCVCVCARACVCVCACVSACVFAKMYQSWELVHSHNSSSFMYTQKYIEAFENMFESVVLVSEP